MSKLIAMASILVLLTVFSIEAGAKPQARKRAPARSRVSTCMTAPACRGGAIYTAPYGVGINLQECYQSGGASIRGENGACYNLAVTTVETPVQKPKRQQINLNQTCYEMECDCVNGLTTYINKTCGQ